MRSCSSPDLRTKSERIGALFEQLERETTAATAEELNASIGRAASLSAVFHARYMAAVSQTAAAPSLPRYLDPKAAAAFLGISRSTLLRLARAETLRSIHPTEGTVRFDRLELEAFMECRASQPSIQAKARR
jgi:excisionase family DNA binding protein